MSSDIDRAILWWDEWQLRILVLGSLALQWFLLLTAPMRKYSIPWWLRKCIWLAYISSDALAIYALATLFNRHAKASSSCAYGGRASSLEVLWAPILLVYLGGRDEITAFNIEDNEMWTRQAVTLVSQVTVAVYAFCKSWPEGDDRRLLVTAILLFICGIINFCEKPWALRRASINQLVAMSSSVVKDDEKAKNGTGWVCVFFEQQRSKSKVLSEMMDQVQMILADLSRLAATHGGRELRKLGAGVEVTPWLRQAFELIYTRANVSHSTPLCVCNFLVVPALYVAAIILFATSRKHGYNDTDIKMTYILMCFTAVLDVLGVIIGKLIYKMMSYTGVPAFCQMLLGYNLISSVLDGMKCSSVKCAQIFSCCFQADCVGIRSGVRVADFVVYKLLKLHKVEYLDLASYRSLNANKNWVLNKEQVEDVKKTTIMKDILCESPFDESVLVWHIATDLCFRAMKYDKEQSEPLRESCTKAISNYMAYLLNFKPEMLMTGSRKHIFTETMKDLEKRLAPWKEGKNQKSLATTILEEGKNGNDEKSIIGKAYKLAEELKKMDNDEKPKKLLYCVWMGMLCYSASMCRGYLHAKALGEGGEFLSFVWLVISLKGAKTLADTLQMPRQPEEEGPTQESQEHTIQEPEFTLEDEDISQLFSV